MSDDFHRAALTKLFEITNAFDVEAALALFAPDAIIDDPSVGETFNGRAGIREYLDRFFVGYRTSTQLLSMQILATNHVRARTAFTGSFGHEIGVLEVSFDTQGRIAHVDADLE